MADGEGERDSTELDLYDDLIDPFFSLQNQQCDEDENGPYGVNKEVRAEIEALESHNKQLSVTNDALKKNISCLFKTARLEIERKNMEIKRNNMEITSLNEQIASLQQMIKHVTGKLVSLQASQNVAFSPVNGLHALGHLVPTGHGSQASNSVQSHNLLHGTVHTGASQRSVSSSITDFQVPGHSMPAEHSNQTPNLLQSEYAGITQDFTSSAVNGFDGLGHMKPAKLGETVSNSSKCENFSDKMGHMEGHKLSSRHHSVRNGMSNAKLSPCGPQMEASSLQEDGSGPERGRFSPVTSPSERDLPDPGRDTSEIPLPASEREEGEVSDSSTNTSSHPGRTRASCHSTSKRCSSRVRREPPSNHKRRHRSRSPLHHTRHNQRSRHTMHRRHPSVPSHCKDHSTHNSDRGSCSRHTRNATKHNHSYRV